MSLSQSKTLELATQHILDNLAPHRSALRTDVHPPPLFVALQGPQGSGKTYLTSQIKSSLSNAPHSLKVAVLSIDDLYLPHAGLASLANQYPTNRLWKGRGQPGTHDIDLGIEIFDHLAVINEERRTVELPVFDKSLHHGEGDRLLPGSGELVHPPLDVVILEGWCVGFYPISSRELQRRWDDVWPDESLKLELCADAVCGRDDLVMVNESLKKYVNLWRYFSVFIQLQPQASLGESPYGVIYGWRLQQEHHMKERNGGRGMTDEAVKLFVDRYIPGYVFFGDGMSRIVDGIERPPWSGNGLRLLVGRDRELLTSEIF